MARKAKVKRQRGKRSSDWRPAFLAAYAITGQALEACEAVPISFVTVWREKQKNPEFAAAYEEARISGAQSLEREAVRRAREGVRKLKFYEGVMITIPDPSGEMVTLPDGDVVPKMVPYVEHEYSDTLLALLLKRHFPQEYRERPPEVNVTANTTANLTIVVSESQLADLQARRKAATEGLVSGRN